MRSRNRAAFTLVELMIVASILAILSTTAFTSYRSSIGFAEETVAVTELQDIHATILLYEQQNGELPATLDDLGMGPLVDPWGNPYQYLNFDAIEGDGKKRKDRFIVPINTSFDLYSMGPDGRSCAALTAGVSLDDIIVANDGDYIGVASSY